jgi:hypothetical protein
VNKNTYAVEIECGNVLEETLDLALKPPSFGGSGIRPKRPQRVLRRASVGEDVFVQVATEDSADFRKR